MLGALVSTLTACNGEVTLDTETGTGTETDTDTGTSTGTSVGETTVDPTTGPDLPTTTVEPTTVEPTTVDPTTVDPTTVGVDTETGTTTLEETTSTGTTVDTDTSTGTTAETTGTTTDTDTGTPLELTSVWAASNPAGFATDALVGLAPALDAQIAEVTLAGDVVSIQSVALTGGGDGIVTFDAPGAKGGVMVVEDIANNPVDGPIGLGDRVIVGDATGLVTPRGLEAQGPDGLFLVADTGAGIRAFDFDDEGDVAPVFVVTDLGSSSAVWDVHYDSSSDVLYAAGTNGDVQVYEDFSITTGQNGPDRTITPAEGGAKISVNLHGIAVHEGTLVLSDVGDAMSATDGQIFVIKDVEFVEGLVDVDQRIQGGKLGNPVDLEVRPGPLDFLIVAEKANDVLLTYVEVLPSGFEPTNEFAAVKPESVALGTGNRVLVAANPAGLDQDAVLAIQAPFDGAPTLTATRNALGSVTSVQSLVLTDAGAGLVGFDGPAASSGGGVFAVEGLTALNGDSMASAIAVRLWGPATGIVTPKGLELNDAGDRLFVADTGASDIKVFDAGALGDSAPLFTITELGGAAAWDVDYDDASDLLFAAGVDGTVRVFENVLANQGAEAPVRTITPTDGQGSIGVNLHGIHYDAATKVLILSDVGDAASPTDGQIFLIAEADLADGEVEVLAQIGGDATKLGNPVDLAFDGANLYVAEKANSLVLRYDAVLDLAGLNNAAESASIAVPNPESLRLGYSAP